MMQSEVKHREVTKDDAVVKPVGKRKKRHRGRHLAAGRHGKPKRLTRGDFVSRRKFAAACRKVSDSSRVARCMRNIVTNNWIRDKVERGTRRVRTLKKRLRTRQEGRIGIKNPDTRRQLRLKIERTSEEFDR
jgi:hypothetical protein